jgi:long-subunit acyl-CoA synthetase (AMP-forming)
MNKFQSYINIQQRPDSTDMTLINDYLNWVDMSTFLEDGKILVKNRRRFMVFTNNGNFIDEVEFNDDILSD